MDILTNKYIKMKKMIMVWIYLSLLTILAWQEELIKYEIGDLKVCIEKGEEWLND